MVHTRRPVSHRWHLTPLVVGLSLSCCPTYAQRFACRRRRTWSEVHVVKRWQVASRRWLLQVAYQLGTPRNGSRGTKLSGGRTITSQPKRHVPSEFRDVDYHLFVPSDISSVPRNFFGGGSTNSAEDRGQRERGSGGGSPLFRGFTQSVNEQNPYSD
jgi:hypothetical protein